MDNLSLRWAYIVSPPSEEEDAFVFDAEAGDTNVRVAIDAENARTLQGMLDRWLSARFEPEAIAGSRNLPAAGTPEREVLGAVLEVIGDVSKSNARKQVVGRSSATVRVYRSSYKLLEAAVEAAYPGLIDLMRDSLK
jgi:hypothetical protein